MYNRARWAGLGFNLYRREVDYLPLSVPISSQTLTTPGEPALYSDIGIEYFFKHVNKDHGEVWWIRCSTCWLVVLTPGEIILLVTKKNIYWAIVSIPYNHCYIWISKGFLEITNGPLHLHLESDQSDKRSSRPKETSELSQNINNSKTLQPKLLIKKTKKKKKKKTEIPLFHPSNRPTNRPTNLS